MEDIINWDYEVHFKEKILVRKDYKIHLYFNIIKNFYSIKTTYYELSWKHKEVDLNGISKEKFISICKELKIKINE